MKCFFLELTGGETLNSILFTWKNIEGDIDTSFLKNNLVDLIFHDE